MHDFPTLASDPAGNVIRTAVLLGTYIGGVTFRYLSLNFKAFVLNFSKRNIQTYLFIFDSLQWFTRGLRQITGTFELSSTFIARS